MKVGARLVGDGEASLDLDVEVDVDGEVDVEVDVLENFMLMSRKRWRGEC